ncbi:HNH endonuclease signature motif containing protein [Catellatospora chokoriensis]|uniref:HNH endonuclease n=1 Tax=Catellatospora chokoriensis TaxID=310353 RepID=A0A8J3JYH5_9ACTN|nr:HNH endonuclease signature motif containing protein [Catellatospora chokoriensis]GIF89197.1 HNH endonuclease [Catellatospora chokoriensis]
MREALVQAERTVAACTDAPVWPLADAELITALDAAHRLRERLAGVELSLVRELDARAVPTAHGASSTAVWLREHWRIGIRTAKQTVELARSLDRLPATAEALAAGTVNTEQAAVIAQALAELPALAGLETAAKAEAALIGFAAQFEPSVLRRFGERVLTHVAPDLAEEHERQALAEHEERAHAARTLTLTPDRSGRVRLAGWLDTEAAAVVTAALDPLARPGALDPARPYVRTGDGIAEDTGTDDGSRTAGHFAPEKTHDTRTAGQRRADALTEICRRVPASGELPDNGGDRPQLIVTVDYDDLARRTGAGLLDNGSTLTPGTVRRVACDAQVIPAVLGGDGQLLDLGRTRRLYTGALRRALVLRDRGCAFPGCDRPPRWCQGHHIRHWAGGGPTDLDNAVLLCGHHHRVIHHDDWHVRLGHDRRPEFIPPGYVDVARHPRRNTFHLRP